MVGWDSLDVEDVEIVTQSSIINPEGFSDCFCILDDTLITGVYRFGL